MAQRNFARGIWASAVAGVLAVAMSLGTAVPVPALAQGPAPANGQARPQVPILTWGTSKPEFWFNPDEESAAQAVRAWFAAWEAGNPLLLGSFVDQNVIFRARSSDDLGHGRDNLMRQVCGYIGGRLNLTGLYVVGGDYDTGVITSWDKFDANGNRTRMGSFFRVQRGLITEWMDSQVDGGPAPAQNQNSAACQAVNAALPPPAAPGN